MERSWTCVSTATGLASIRVGKVANRVPARDALRLVTASRFRQQSNIKET